MKIILGFFLAFALTLNSFGSPLVFKISKEIKSGEFTELATFDASKYHQIRIAVDGAADTDVGANVKAQKKFTVSIYGVEGEREIFLQSQSDNFIQFRTVIDSPPSKIRIKVKGESTYYLHVWAS